MNAGEHQQLARSIYFWLNYHSSVSRSDILLESAVRFPLTEFIERRYHVPVSLECGHPDYDRLRIDFSYIISRKKRNVELKFLHDYSNRNDEFKRFFDDLVRLALMGNEINYFILCGNWDLYHNKILKEPIEIDKGHIPSDSEERPLAKNKFTDILPLHEIGEEFMFEPHTMYDYIGSEKNKDKPEKKIPKRLRQIRVQMVAKVDDENNGSQVVYIWHVKGIMM